MVYKEICERIENEMHTHIDIYIYLHIHTYICSVYFQNGSCSKGNVGYPWQGTLAVVPPILPHFALYNQYIIHILDYIGGICWYICRVLSQGYPTFPFNMCLCKTKQRQCDIVKICIRFYMWSCWFLCWNPAPHDVNERKFHAMNILSW